MYENIYGELDSWKKEFSLQNAVSALANLLLSVFYLYTNLRTLLIMDFNRMVILIFPFISVFYSIFHAFRGAHETMFLVSGRTIVVAGFLALATDFILRVGTWVGLFSYFVRASSCDEYSYLCIELLIDHGEKWCESGQDFGISFPNNGTVNTECCECEVYGIPSDGESLRYLAYAFLLLAVIIGYEIAWVFFFHQQYIEREKEHGRGKIDQSSNWKTFFVKIVQAIILSCTFLSINIPIRGMYRPQYRQLEHYIRVCMSITMGVVFMRLDSLIRNSSVIISLCTVVPLHVFTYVIFEKAFEQHESDDFNLHIMFSDYIGGASSKFVLPNFKSYLKNAASSNNNDAKEIDEASQEVINRDEILGPDFSALSEATEVKHAASES